MTARNRNYLEQGFIRIFSPPKGGTVSLSTEPGLFVLSSEGVYGDCLGLFAKGWVC